MAVVRCSLEPSWVVATGCVVAKILRSVFWICAMLCSGCLVSRQIAAVRATVGATRGGILERDNNKKQGTNDKREGEGEGENPKRPLTYVPQKLFFSSNLLLLLLLLLFSNFDFSRQLLLLLLLLPRDLFSLAKRKSGDGKERGEMREGEKRDGKKDRGQSGHQTDDTLSNFRHLAQWTSSVQVEGGGARAVSLALLKSRDSSYGRGQN